MKLNLAPLLEPSKTVGTPGTTGTANVYEAQSVPTAISPVGILGTPGNTNPQCLRACSRVPTVPTKDHDMEVAYRGVQDPGLWADDFGKWALAECLFLDRCSGGIKALHDAFCEWCIVNETSGPILETFATLLEDEGFRLDECGLVYGLVLRVDAGAYSLAVPERATK